MKTDNKIDKGFLIATAEPPSGSPYIWPENIRIIGQEAFSYWRNYNYPMIIPEGVIEIKKQAFMEWKTFNQPFSIPKSLKIIGDHAFAFWYQFNQPFSIPEGISSIGQYAFFEWNSFNQPNSKRIHKTSNKWLRIDNWVFCGCWSGTIAQLRKRINDPEYKTNNRLKAFELITEGIQ